MKLILANLIVFLLLISCKSSVPISDPVPVHETFSLESKFVGETRIINVWTPPKYANSTEKFPVLYMADGGLKEDFPHIANTLSELIAAKKIPPMILVGIENTQRRKDLTGNTEISEDKKIVAVVGGSKEFRSFIQEELFPLIKKKYRTTDKKAIIGESLSGLFVTETFLEHPEMFDYYIAFDPSLWWNNKYLISTAKEDLSKFPTTPKRFWFAGSGLEDVSSTVGLLAKVLETKNLNNLKWKYSEEPKEKHNSIFRATKEKAIIWTLNVE